MKELIGKLDSFYKLERGWDGYHAESPNEEAISQTKTYLDWIELYPPDNPELFRNLRVAPSVIGGVGVTFKNGQNRVYVEFFNDGNIYSLFSNQWKDVIHSEKVESFTILNMRINYFLKEGYPFWKKKN